MPLTLKDISKEAHDEACVTYAALILQDAGADITADKLAEVVSASGNEVEPYWAPMFADLLSKVDVADLLTSVSAPGSGGGAGGAAGGDAAAAEEEQEEEEEEEEVDVGGGNLFGDDDGY